jgi:Leucine-rich repeat (LRR) protein
MKVQSFTEEIKGTLDLSECENLVKFEYGAQRGCNLNVILPNSISELIYETDGICKVAENTNFNSVELRYSANSFMKDLPESVNIKSLTINGREGIELENLNKLANKSSFEKLKLYSSIYLGNEMKLSGFEKLQGIFYAKNVEIDCVSKISKELFEHFPYIENLKILNSSNVISIEGIENCIKLKQLESVNCSISSLQEITNLENLNLLKIMSNKVSDIIAISNLKKLENLDLSNNNINNLVYLENLIENGRTNLQYLNLEDNIIQTTTLNGHNNVETLKKLYNAGLRTLDISGNNFTAGTTDELKSLKWTSYKE